eukprot:6454816-Amphidinium_carterae.1
MLCGEAWPRPPGVQLRKRSLQRPGVAQECPPQSHEVDREGRPGHKPKRPTCVYSSGNTQIHR